MAKPKSKPAKAKSFRSNAGSTVPVEVVGAHFNADLDPERMEAVAESYLTGAKIPEHIISIPAAKDALNRLKIIECPAGCPTDQEEWKQEVARLLGIAVYKMAFRLANEGDTMALTQIPVAMAISLDKRLLLAGQPTSFDFRVNATVNHEALLKRIKGAERRGETERKS
jgi:hypothetical protein